MVEILSADGREGFHQEQTHRTEVPRSTSAHCVFVSHPLRLTCHISRDGK